MRGVSASSISLQWSPTMTLRDTASSPKCPMAACGSMRSDTKSPTNLDCAFPATKLPKTYKVIWRIGHDVGARLIGPAAQPMQKDQFSPRCFQSPALLCAVAASIRISNKH